MFEESRTYSGLITARSSEIPVSTASGPITYSVQVEYEDGVVVFEGVVTQDYYRAYSVDVDLEPFPIGFRVPMLVSYLGSTESWAIATGERPAVEECA